MKQFDQIAKTEAGTEFLNKLPFDMFFELITADDLNVSAEMNVVKVITRFLNHKATFPPLKEEDPLQDTTHLTEEEKKNREEQKQKAVAEETKKKEEEKKAQEE